MARELLVWGRGNPSGLLLAMIKSRQERSAVLFTLLASMLAYVMLALPAAAEERVPSLDSGVVLVMVEEDGCGYCKQWLADVGPGYDKSDEGLRAPLVRIEIGSKEATRFERVVYTPTFLLLQDGKELGRILGYAGADLFWWQLTELLDKHASTIKSELPADAAMGEGLRKLSSSSK